MEPADVELLPESLLPAEFESEDIPVPGDPEPSAPFPMDVAIFLCSGYVTFLLSLILEFLDLPYTETAMINPIRTAAITAEIISCFLVIFFTSF
jgi:CBS domain containing-hemolysin-like protein